MSRLVFQRSLLAGMLAATMISSAGAQVGVIRAPSPQPVFDYQPRKIIINPHPGSGPPLPMRHDAQPVRRIPAQNGYVRLQAPLYPVPRPNIPYQVGSTFNTNQAFAPYEMLYPHSYRALYPPYYYEVNGRWYSILGHMTNHEYWKLRGTSVQVDYCSRIPLMSRFRNPLLWFD